MLKGILLPILCSRPLVCKGLSPHPNICVGCFKSDGVESPSVFVLLASAFFNFLSGVRQAARCPIMSNVPLPGVGAAWLHIVQFRQVKMKRQRSLLNLAAQLNSFLDEQIAVFETKIVEAIQAQTPSTPSQPTPSGTAIAGGGSIDTNGLTLS